MAKTTVVPKVRYEFDPVYQGIRNRFRIRHAINLAEHVESMTWLSPRLEEGFNFVPFDATEWAISLRRAGFKHDDRDKHLGVIPSVGALAALATHGEGFREPGSPSLHCAIAPDICNVHLDNVGFRLEGYGPDAGEHIADELVWQTDIVPALGKVLPASITNVLHRVHPVVPNSRQIRPFSEVGAELDLASGRSKDLQRHWRVTIDVTHSCSDNTCGAWNKLNGQTVAGDNRMSLMFKVVGL